MAQRRVNKVRVVLKLWWTLLFSYVNCATILSCSNTLKRSTVITSAARMELFLGMYNVITCVNVIEISENLRKIFQNIAGICIACSKCFTFACKKGEYLSSLVSAFSSLPAGYASNAGLSTVFCLLTILLLWVCSNLFLSSSHSAHTLYPSISWLPLLLSTFCVLLYHFSLDLFYLIQIAIKLMCLKWNLPTYISLYK